MEDNFLTFHHSDFKKNLKRFSPLSILILTSDFLAVKSYFYKQRQSPQMLKIDLDELQNGLPGFTSIAGSFLAEAAIYCLELSGHKTGVELLVQLDGGSEQVTLNWHSALSPDVASTWQDEQELVEYAAVGIALPLILQISGYSDVQRARKGSSVDFWLGRKDEQGFPILEALLEVSGILRENPGNTLIARFKQKVQQVGHSPYRNLPVFIIVVEFSMPKAKLEQL